MSYIIRKTDETTLGTILDGTVDTAHTSLTLVGRNYSNYGQIMTDNLVALTENFAKSTAPSNSLPGQLWWDTSANLLKVWIGTAYKVVGSAVATSIPPTTTLAGDLWWDTTNEQFYVYNGTSPYASSGWILCGPTWSKVTGKSGALRETITDTSASVHAVISLYLDGVRTAIISQDSEFTPASPGITGFTTIKTGHNIHSSETFWGTANNASYLGGIIATNYLRTDINNSSTGNLHIVNDSGVTIGAGLDLTLSVSGVNASITNNSSNGDINLVTNSTTYLTVKGATNVIEVAAVPTTTLGIATKGYVDDSFANSPSLGGIPTAPTMPALTANTSVATTDFVINNSGFQKNKIYQGNSKFEINDIGVGSADLTIDGFAVLVAATAGIALFGNPETPTQTQTRYSVGDRSIASTSYVHTATQLWDGSAKVVSLDAPNPGVNDIGSADGDIWFQYTA